MTISLPRHYCIICSRQRPTALAPRYRFHFALGALERSPQSLTPAILFLAPGTFSNTDGVLCFGNGYFFAYTSTTFYLTLIYHNLPFGLHIEAQSTNPFCLPSRLGDTPHDLSARIIPYMNHSFLMQWCKSTFLISATQFPSS